jgi:hypothetical protein
MASLDARLLPDQTLAARELLDATRITNVLNIDLPPKDQQQPEPEPVINGGRGGEMQRNERDRLKRLIIRSPKD